MQTRILAVATMLVATIFASIAFAQEAPPEPPEWVTWMKAIAEPLIEPLALILGAVALVLARRVSTWIAAKLGVEDARALSLIEGQVVKVVDGGIAYTEQRGGVTVRRGELSPVLTRSITAKLGSTITKPAAINVTLSEP